MRSCQNVLKLESYRPSNDLSTARGLEVSDKIFAVLGLLESSEDHFGSLSVERKYKVLAVAFQKI